MTIALLAAASFGGWVVMLGMLVGMPVDMHLVQISFYVITLLYGLLAFATGNALGRRQGMRGIAGAALGALLAWAILEFFFHLFEIGSAQMRAPLILGVALAVLGSAIGVTRPADRAAVLHELRQELEELDQPLPEDGDDDAEAESDRGV
ncbi:MAG: hypothetical protein GX131_00260 [candidate division WS1 bacterium]|nr:hypothetical protein [candidate division WS1 bacterium]